MFIFGAAGASVTGQSDISEVMIAQGLLIPAIIVLGLNIWTTNDNALYASGLGFSNITGLPSKYISMANGLVGTLCALWLYNNFVGWLTFLSLAIPPIGGVIIADFFTNRKRYANFEAAQFQSVNWAGIIAVAIGVGAGHFLPGVVPINAVLGGAISFLILNPILNKSTGYTASVRNHHDNTTDQNVTLKGQEGLQQILIEDGQFKRIESNDVELNHNGDTIDAEGGMAVAPFCEPHIHLDTTQTAGEPSWNISGTLFEGIERWAERKEMLSIEDVKARAKQTLKWQIANGVQHVRTHVDVSDPTLIALKAMLEVREEMKEWVDIQIVAFPQEGILCKWQRAARRSRQIGADVIGAIPHFEFTRIWH